jgi:hypothetical protein
MFEWATDDMNTYGKLEIIIAEDNVGSTWRARAVSQGRGFSHADRSGISRRSERSRFLQKRSIVPTPVSALWITNYAQRTIAVLATVIAIIVPLFSYAPKLYRGLVENRLRSMYRRLRAIEATLQR